MVNRISRTLCIPRAVFVVVAACAFACSDDEVPAGPCGEGFDPDRRSFVDDGQCCEFSVNCRAGSACNTPDEPEGFYFPEREMNICIRVVCSSNADCEGNQECSPEKLCRPPVCQRANDCPPGQTCLGGTCRTPPDAAAVARCDVVTRGTTLKQGQTLALSAVARAADGEALAGIAFNWMSSRDAVVSVTGTIATGGSMAGTASLTAQPEGRSDVTCDGSVALVNLPNLAQGVARVIVVGDTDGSPVEGASVFLEAGATLTASTSSDGAATVTVSAPVETVTVWKDGYEMVSVVSPGTNDIFVPLPRMTRNDVAGGFRGVLDLASTESQQVKVGFVAPAIPRNLLDLDLTALIGDLLPTVIDAPELMLNNQQVDLPGGLVVGLGSRTFTGDTTRCRGVAPGTDELGCFVVRAPAGPTAAWGFGGQLPIADLGTIANQLSDLLGGTGTDVPIGDILAAVFPLVQNLNHAVDPVIDIEEFPRVGGQPDYSSFSRVDLSVDTEQTILSAVRVPTLPDLPNTSSCAAGALVVGGALLEGRGLVPLGLAAGLDTLDDSATPDCEVEGVEEPFGSRSDPLPDGQVPLSIAPLHSGMEGSQVFLLAVALDPDSLTGGGGIQFSVLVRRVDEVIPSEAFTRPYPAMPEANVSRSAATVQFRSSLTGQTMVRAELQSRTQTWLVYGPASQATLSLPNVAQGRAVLDDLQGGLVMTMGTRGTYDEVWTFGSGGTLDRLVDTLTSFVIQECTATPGANCVLQN